MTAPTAKVITEQEGIDVLAQVVAEKGEDFQYAIKGNKPGRGPCKYQHDGEPSCLIGQALFKLGVPIEGLGILDEQYPGWDGGAARYVADEFGIDTSAALEVWTNAQNNQDSGLLYGEVLERARTYHQDYHDEDDE